MLDMQLLWTCFLALCLLATPGFAQTTGDAAVGGGVSVFGPILETSYHIERNSRLRGIFMGGLTYDTVETDNDGNSYDVDLELAAAAVLFDYYPDQSGWRVSGGVLIDLTDFTATARGGDGSAFNINNAVFPGGNVMAEAHFANELSPMVTAGYDVDLGNSWIVSGELGAIYTGGLETDFTANTAALQGAIDNDEDFQAYRRDLEAVQVLPYVSVAVSFRF